MNAYSNIEFVAQTNFPASKAGELASVKYTVYELDSTGAPTVYIAQTNDDVMETEDGAYQINLTLPKGKYSINWEITGTPYVSNEDINVLEDIWSKIDSQTTLLQGAYTGVGYGSRYGVEVDISVPLQFQFLKNNIKFTPYQVTKVEVYSTLDDAKANTNIVETIISISGPAVTLETGLYAYTASSFTVQGTKYDKVYVIPVQGDVAQSYILPFYITADIGSAGQPSTHITKMIYLNLFDVIDNPAEDTKVYVKLNKQYAWYDKDIITEEIETFKADATGKIVMELIETDTLTEDPSVPDGEEIYYEFNVDNRYFSNRKVPRSIVTEADFKDLPEVT
ncbi:MAG: hypothetical protein KAX49_13720 [Halanaerobiales bacterium]|nr:hypothetical protein [Halanaerobiales bacterium]